MNQARQAFERFEKSDNWLPVLLLSLLGIGGTIGIVTVATDLQQDNVAAATESMYFLSGEMIGFGLAANRSNEPLKEHELSRVEVDGLAKIQGWGDGYTFVAGFNWSPSNALTKELQEESPERKLNLEELPIIKLLCWISDDKKSLLTTRLQPAPASETGLSVSRFAGARIISFEKGTDKQLITSEFEAFPEAPWESIVSMDEQGVAAKDLFAAHLDHISGKDLQVVDLNNLGSELKQMRDKKCFWVFERGGLSEEEVDRVGQNLLGEFSDVEQGWLETNFKMGFMIGLSKAATDHALTIYNEGQATDDRQGKLVIHGCSHFGDLGSAFDDSTIAFDTVVNAVNSEMEELGDDDSDQGPALAARTESLKNLIAEGDQFATLLHEMEEPFKAKIYKLKEAQPQTND